MSLKLPYEYSLLNKGLYYDDHGRLNVHLQWCHNC